MDIINTITVNHVWSYCKCEYDYYYDDKAEKQMYVPMIHVMYIMTYGNSQHFMKVLTTLLTVSTKAKS